MGSINFRDALATAVDVSSPLPDGTYHAKVTGAELRSSSNGKPQIKLNLKVLYGEYANRGCSKLITISADSQDAMGMFFRDMETLGIPREYFNSDSASEEEVVQILNQNQPEVNIVTDEAKAFNKDFTNVQYLRKAPAGQAQAPAPVAAGPTVAQVASVAPPAVVQPSPVAVAPPPVAPPPVPPFQQ